MRPTIPSLNLSKCIERVLAKFHHKKFLDIQLLYTYPKILKYKHLDSWWVSQRTVIILKYIDHVCTQIKIILPEYWIGFLPLVEHNVFPHQSLSLITHIHIRMWYIFIYPNDHLILYVFHHCFYLLFCVCFNQFFSS